MWEQLSLAGEYEVQIAKDKGFSLRITQAEPQDNPFYQPAMLTSPAYSIVPGILPEAGHTYYYRVRVRQAATGQIIRSPWSEKRSFSIKAGLPVVSRHLGAQALKPGHGAAGISVSSVGFSWTPFKGTTEYRFVLARDSGLVNRLAEETVPSTAYNYRGRLDYATNYFWQVTATKPLPGEPSPVFSFTTESPPVSPPAAPAPDEQLSGWLQASILVNVLFSVSVLVLLIIVLIRSRWLRS